MVGCNDTDSKQSSEAPRAQAEQDANFGADRNVQVTRKPTCGTL